MIMSTPSTSEFLSGDESSSALYDRTGRRFAYTPKHLANPEQSLFRPLLRRDVIEFRQTHGAHQCGVGLERQVDGFLGQGTAGLVNRDPAHQALGQHGLVMKLLRDLVQYFDCLACDLGADSVTGEYQYVKLHVLS